MSSYKHTLTETRIIRAIAAMPYGALVHVKVGFGQQSEPVTHEQIAAYLETLKDVLERHANHAAADAELAQLRGDLAAVRRVFGVDK